jgi:hypothetical protein
MPGRKTRAPDDTLMGRMAETLGVDLEAAAMQGVLPPETQTAMVQACGGCAKPGACGHWLERTARATAAPEYCRNADILRALATEERRGPPDRTA